MSLTPALKQQFENDIKSNKILIFMKGTPEAPMCGFSARTVQLLQAYKIPFKAVNVLDDEGVRQGIKEFTNWPTIPQVFINGEFVGGCDILSEMHASGDLKKLLSV